MYMCFFNTIPTMNWISRTSPGPSRKPHRSRPSTLEAPKPSPLPSRIPNLRNSKDPRRGCIENTYKRRGCGF